MTAQQYLIAAHVVCSVTHKDGTTTVTEYDSDSMRELRTVDLGRECEVEIVMLQPVQIAMGALFRQKAPGRLERVAHG